MGPLIHCRRNEALEHSLKFLLHPLPLFRRARAAWVDFLGRKGLWYFRARDLSRGQVLEGAGYLGLSDSWLLVNELGGFVKE